MVWSKGLDPKASRETLDHSIMYIFAVALEDGGFHHVESYTPERASRPGTLRLWHSIETREDPEWTRRYHAPDPTDRATGGRVEVFLKDGTRIEDELAVANAHPRGARPFGRAEYLHKFHALTEGIVSPAEASRFIEAAQRLAELRPGELHQLNVAVPASRLIEGASGIF